MRFSLFLSVALSLATGSLTAPTAPQAPAPFEFIAAKSSSTKTTLTKRNIGGVRLCTGVNWSGICDYVIWPLNECISLND